MSLPSWCPPYNSTKYLPSSEEVYCICKKTDTGELMVCCDGCDDWYHFNCIKIPIIYKDLVFSFYCPYCQAGITGPSIINGGKLPKTIWKRKCRLNGCYKECGNNSKYCSLDHGKKYIQNVWNQIETPNLNKTLLVKQMINVGNFSQIGTTILPKVDREDNPKLYDSLIVEDIKLKQLNEQLDQLSKIHIPEIETKKKSLNEYLNWLNKVNMELFGSRDNVADSKTKRKRPSGDNKSLCGYKSNFEIPSQIEEFISKYSEDVMLLQDICTKLKCKKHQDWSGILMNEIDFEVETLIASEKRLNTLIKIRTDQLNIQFFEKVNSKHEFIQ